MARWKALIAVMLLAVWLPATSHCALEAVGVLEMSAGCASTTDCAGDSCSVIENGFSKQSNLTVKVSAPDLTACLFSLCLHLAAPTTLISVADFSLGVPVEPQDWIVCWTFEHRAALPARAPDFVA